MAGLRFRSPAFFCLKLGLIPNFHITFGITIPNFYMIFGIRAFFVYLCKGYIVINIIE